MVTCALSWPQPLPPGSFTGAWGFVLRVGKTRDRPRLITVRHVDELLQARLRALPSIDELVNRPSLATLPVARSVLVTAARTIVDAARAQLVLGVAVPEVTEALVEAEARRLALPRLRRVINATGVVLHTNLGRAPLAEAAVTRVADVARGYCNLELDLASGERGSRMAPLKAALATLTGADDSLVVNNGAAAVLLVCSALAEGREVIVSRGELVEIGGGFRIPEVMAQSRARLVEVGTTNRTRLADYERALTTQTGLVAKVHRSNFSLVGFTEDASMAELSALTRSRGVPLFADLGSGSLERLGAADLEPTVREVVEAGADVVTFSGDKLLGGPQAGVIVGRKEWMARLRQHPLHRALRVDKLTVAALEATLQLYATRRSAEVPVRRMLTERLADLEARARTVAARLGELGVRAQVRETEGRIGGGASPEQAPASWAVVLEGKVEVLHRRLRGGPVAVLGRIERDQVWLDVRCVDATECESLATAVAAAYSNVELEPD